MTQLTEAIPKLTNGGALKNDESEDKDEFFDATDVSFGESESDVYDDNVEFVVTESTDLDDDVMLEVDDKLHELGLMLNSTLASDYNGANAARLNAHFFNDWRILLEKQALELGFPNLDELLKSKYMSDYVEQTSVVNGIATYGAVSKPASEHILRRVADCRLNEDQRAEKRRIQRLMKLKSPENEQNFLEGKRRILEILVDLKADKVEVDYQIIRDEYMKRYSISLNASEHLRLFMNKSALKNFWRVFYREVILISGSPIRVKLRSSDVKIPEEITEDLHLLANIDKIELPIFALECRPQISNIIREGRTVKYSKGVAVSGETIPKKPTMDWGEEMEEDEDRQASNEKQRKSDIGNADRINGTVSSSMTKTMCFPADSEGVQENGDDRAQRRLSQKPVDLTDGKYTGDEESADSSDPEGKVSRKYRKKKFKGNVNTFNISTSSEVKPLLQIACVDEFENLSSYSGKNSNSVEQSSRLMDNGENKQSGKRLKIAERSLQQSLGHFYPRDRFPSSFTAFNNRNSAGLVPMYKPTQSAVFNRQCSEEYHETRASEHRNFDLYSEEETNKLPYGSYSIPNSVAEQCSSHQGHSHKGGFVQSYQPNQFQQHGQDYPDDCAASVGFFPCFYNKEVIQLSKGTQTDENWLETLLDELGCHNTEKSPLKKLAEVIELVVDIRSPNPVLLSALPQIIGSFYGAPLNPEKDQNYRKPWREVVRDHCSAEILIAPLPNGEEVLIKR